MRTRVQVVSMRSWGELGNLLAGQTLAATLRAGLCDVDTSVVEAETLFPAFAEVGAAIRELVSAGLPAGEIGAGYLRVMAGLTGLLYPGFEADPDPPPRLRSHLTAIADHFDRTRPDVVIGTKGVISRLCLAALRLSGRTVPVANYVTNEGLLRLAVHRSTELPVHLVQFERAKRYLVEEHGYDPRRVITVGRLLARAQAGRFFEGDVGADTVDPVLATASTRVVILSNRGGPEYLDLIDRLSEKHPRVAIAFVAYNNHAMAEEAARLLTTRAVPAWRTFDRLKQGDYLRYLDWLAGARAPLFISKTGPNSMLECLYFGIPQLLVRSGLPMEEWVGPFLAEHRVGQVFDRMADLTEAAVRLLADPDELPKRRQRALRMAETVLDPEHARRRTVSAVAALLHDLPPQGDGPSQANGPSRTVQEPACSPE